MPDYGQPLRFGLSVTPATAEIDEIAALVDVADTTKLDLVAIQDHAYNPDFLDTWTLIAFLAARTDRVRFFPDVADLALRPPAMLAKAAASLDRLSGGRVELGLGAGAFWDRIATMGGPRRAPAEAVKATAKAIQVIRLAWRRVGRSRSRGVTTTCAAISPDLARRTRWRSGWAQSGRACWASLDGSRTAGSRRSTSSEAAPQTDEAWTEGQSGDCLKAGLRSRGKRVGSAGSHPA
jgi:alkanesulfonate monooxygenase SsuD/methylene tetrahydromethanopterin reductase-like flavin-dependent oxidoreductase (luciferase family)